MPTPSTDDVTRCLAKLAATACAVHLAPTVTHRAKMAEAFTEAFYLLDDLRVKPHPDLDKLMADAVLLDAAERASIRRMIADEAAKKATRGLDN